MTDPLSLIEPCWIEKSDLSSQEYKVLSMPAKSLLHPLRFDLFAKIYYLKNRRRRRFFARKVYFGSLRCIIPGGKEFGKEEVKKGFARHRRMFDELADSIAASGFDFEISLIPLGGNGLLLDGAHRSSVSALTGKDVTVCFFPEVQGDSYDYSFFRERWMSDYLADLTAREGVRWLDGIKIICLWPGGEVDTDGLGTVFYARTIKVGKSAFTKLRADLEPGWDDEPIEEVFPAMVRFVFYIPETEDVRPVVSGDHLIVTSSSEVERIADLILTTEGRRKWFMGGGLSGALMSSIALLNDVYRSDRSYLRKRCELRKKESRFVGILARWDNKYWIWFYGLVSKLWKKGDE